MNENEIISIIKEMCNNGTHSCKINDLLSVTGVKKQELWGIIKKLPFKWQIADNINGIKLLVIESQ